MNPLRSVGVVFADLAQLFSRKHARLWFLLTSALVLQMGFWYLASPGPALLAFRGRDLASAVTTIADAPLKVRESRSGARRSSVSGKRSTRRRSPFTGLMTVVSSSLIVSMQSVVAAQLPVSTCAQSAARATSRGEPAAGLNANVTT